MKRPKRDKDGDDLRDKVFSVLAALDKDRAERILVLLLAAASLDSRRSGTLMNGPDVLSLLDLAGDFEKEAAKSKPLSEVAFTDAAMWESKGRTKAYTEVAAKLRDRLKELNQ